jgi:hypothetical protein
MMKSLPFAAAVVLALAAGPATAKTKSFSLTAKDMYGSGDAELDTYGRFWRLNDTSNGTVSLNFTLPNDYKKNSPAVVLMSLANVGGCEFDFRGVNIGRFRTGQAWFSTAGPGSGFTKIGQNLETAPASGQTVFTSDFELKPASNNTGFSIHKPGDVITLNFHRFGGPSPETCTTELYVIKAKIKYQTPD